MKKITFWLFALFTCWQISAQTGMVVIGVNDGTPNSATNYPSPMQDYYKTGKVQFLYKASELTGAGLVAGNITEIGWVVTSNNASSLQENYTISMKSTASTVLTSTFETGATLVYGPTDFTPSATGNVMFTLATPFMWDGTSNVIVEVCAGLETGGYTQNVSCANSTTTGIQTVYFRSDSGTTPCATATGTTSNERPLLIATGNVASCLAPLNLVSANVSANTADISWDASSSNPSIGYEYVVSTSSVAPTGAGTATTNLYAIVSSLLPQTTYYVYIRSNCAAGQFSGWNGPISFTTGCVAVSNFNQNFDGVTTPALPGCWSKILSGTGISTFATVGTLNYVSASAPNGVDLYNSDSGATSNIMLVSPMLSNLSAGTHRLKFKARNTSDTQDLEIGVLTDPADASTFTLVQAVDITNAFQNYVVNFDTFTGPGSVIALRRLSTSMYTNVYLDDIIWEAIPSCPDQTGLVVANITSTSAETSWDDTSANGSVGYEYAITTSATPPASGTATTNAYYIASSLLPQTTYYLHVRSECAGSTFGYWATMPFTTNCASVTSFVQNFDSVTTPDFPTCWAKVGNGGYANTQSVAANSYPNAMYMVSYAASSKAVVKMQPVSNLGAGTNRIKFNMRGYYGVGDIIEFGYLTDPLDANTFVVLTTFTASNLTYTTYQFSPPAGAYSDFPAFRHTANIGNSVLIDNVIWEAIPTCPDQTGLVVSNITSSGANTSWDDMSVSGVTGYEYAVTTSATPPASGTATTNAFYAASGLASQTAYYLHVRTTCGAGNYGVWISIPFTTQCSAITTLPWIEGFETAVLPAFPPCWLEENGDWQTSNSTNPNTPHSGSNYLRNAYYATNEYMWTPGFDLAAGTSYDFSSWIQGDGGNSWSVDFYVNNAQNSVGATQLGAQFIVPGTGTITTQAYNQVTRTFVPATSGTYYFAFRVNEPIGSWYVAIDDVELKISPSTPPTCATNLVATPNACGNFASNLNWDVTPSAAGYYVTIGTTAGGTDIANAINVGPNSYSFSGSIGTTYFWKVVPYNAAGSATGCTEQSFTTAATGCYCASVPTSNDGPGITTAIIGATTNTIADVTYADLTAVPEIIPQGANANMQLTFSTGYTYDVNVWIDFNNDYDFNDVGELVKTGIACTTALPNTVDASFMMPSTAPTGVHRMRIGSADSGQNPPNPCFSGSYGVTLDFTIDTALSSNSFDTNTFVAYPNPVKDVLNLSYKTAISDVKIYNLLGQEVLNTKTNTSDVQVNMSALTAGAYIVHITVEDTIHTIKVIKE